MTSVASTATWVLSSPWYRADSVLGGAARRGSGPPIIQKYAASDPITPFMGEPQESLRFTGDDLLRHLFGQRHVLLDSSNRGREPLKLFQPLHARFYLVVCQLYCRSPGWPAVGQDQVCEAGFVLRRRVPNVPETLRFELNQHLARKQTLLTQAEYLLGSTGGLKSESSMGFEDQLKSTVKRAKKSAGGKRLAKIQGQVDAVNQQIGTIVAGNGLGNVDQGWLASEHPGIGAWSAEIEAAPQDLGDEVVLPLFPLIPDPAAEQHSGRGASLYYGLIPTHSGDIDGKGDPRLDDRSLYHIRCFVRRHRPGCPRTAQRGDCPGELVWSAPTESFRLASPYDLEGTSNRPINIRMPDLAALKNQALRGGAGSVGGRMSVPPDSALTIKSDYGGGSLNTPTDARGEPGGGDQVCFFAIPLITLIALFVLNIFLPILMFVLQLWWMLRLKLCIPPSIEIDADLAVELEVTPPSIEVDLELDAEFSIEIGGTIFNGGGGQASVTAVKDALKAELVPGGQLDPRFLDAEAIEGIKAEIDDDLGAAVDLLKTLGSDLEAEDSAVPTGSNGLVYFEVVTRA